MKINKTALGIIIIALSLLLSQNQKQSELRQFEGAYRESCFDYQDNDNDGKFDLYDNNCLGLGMEDSDFDGYTDVDEWEHGSNVFDPSSHPQ